jgi:hypothetical protein
MTDRTDAERCVLQRPAVTIRHEPRDGARRLEQRVQPRRRLPLVALLEDAAELVTEDADTAKVPLTRSRLT